MSADLGVWRAGLGIGLGALRRAPSLGLKRLLLPVSYWRYAEFSYVVRQLTVPPGSRVLDLGSPKDLAAMLARGRGYAVVATDILDSAVQLSARYCAALGIVGDGAGRVRSEVVDGRHLPYPTGSFDAAFSVSVVEHIPGTGDTDAMRELARVVRPGGLIVVTTPYAPVPRDTYVDRPVYERAQPVAGEPVFYERHYDDATLRSRLIDGTDTQLVNLEHWGEGAVRMERLLSRAGPIRTAASPLEPLLASRCLRCVDGEHGGHPMAAFFTLRRTAA